MTKLNPVSYAPDAARQEIYSELYRLYRQVHDAFGGVNKSADLSRVMKDLIALKQKVAV
jgi:L-ribulokinase